ncbi:MAG: OmpH family outer membrane protein [Rhodospirillaceae bacterium]|nr:OmpH family outer membrane protein [Rhodospirillaceae bacterium]
MTLRRFVLASLAVFTLIATPAQMPRAVAQDAAVPVSVAVLDLPIILRDSTAAQAVRTQIEQQRQRFQSELAQQEQALQAESQALESQRGTMTAEAIAQKQQEMSQKVQQLRQQSELRRQQLEDAFNAAMDEVRQSVIDILTEIAQARGYTLVLNKSTVLLSANEFDITNEVLTQLNQRLPSTQIPGIQ